RRARGFDGEQGVRPVVDFDDGFGVRVCHFSVRCGDSRIVGSGRAHSANFNTERESALPERV
ncbi:MAG: hypothetical protein OXU96_08610, partial [Gammaproteobacteria bacterium]|nr:hypothetical protein [Gammaproteobacteria bacterium]